MIVNSLQGFFASVKVQNLPAQSRTKFIKWLASGLMASALGMTAQSALAIQFYDITPIGLYDAGHTGNRVQFLSNAGQVVGFADRYNGATWNGRSAWYFNGSSTQEIGLTDANHTSSTGELSNVASFLNNAGQVAGYARHYSGETWNGYSAWYFNGSSTQQIGLTDAGHTSSTGEQNNSARFLNNAGQVAGTAQRYNGALFPGQSAWYFNGSGTQEIGLTDAGHTSSAGEQSNFVWSLNNAGQVVGSAQRYNGVTSAGTSAWYFNGSSTQEIGLTNSEHTSSTGERDNFASVLMLNDAGQVAGSAQRYNGVTPAGASAWYFNGSNTQKIGLTDANHTSSTGQQSNYAQFLNNAGQVAGSARRYNVATWSYSAWYFNGSNTQQIGLTDSSHTSSAGEQNNSVRFLNNAGQVAGHAQRYNGSSTAGQSAWYFGSSTQEIGLTDAGHTSSTGMQSNSVQFLNNAGQVAGHAQRYNGTSFAGQSAWYFNGSSTQEIGLTDAGHTSSSTGEQSNFISFQNNAGQVAGQAQRYNGASYAGLSAWFYDPAANQTFMMNETISVLWGSAYSSIQYLDDNGLALGVYELYNAYGSLGYRVFSFTVADGWNDLGSLVNGGLSAAGWDYLANVYDANGAGQIIGQGVLAGMSDQTPYLLTPVPEPETWAMLLVGLGLVGRAVNLRRRAEI